MGELYRRSLLLESIVLSVFEMLLGDKDRADLNKNVNDYTVEGATVLMNKVGNILDIKLEKIKQSIVDGTVKDIEKVTKQKIESTFNRFKNLSNDETDPPISTRIKMLIMNMFDNRATNWEKLKKQNESGPMKVEELRKEAERKAFQEQEERLAAERQEMAYLGDQGGRSGGGKYNNRSNTQYDNRQGGQQ